MQSKQSNRLIGKGKKKHLTSTVAQPAGTTPKPSKNSRFQKRHAKNQKHQKRTPTSKLAGKWVRQLWANIVCDAVAAFETRPTRCESSGCVMCGFLVVFFWRKINAQQCSSSNKNRNETARQHHKNTPPCLPFGTPLGTAD